MRVKRVTKLEQWAIKRLRPYEKNPRVHSPEQIKLIAECIKEAGFVNPIIVHKSEGIIAGHGRLLAARELRLPTVPVVRADHLTRAQARAYRIADNQLALLSTWDRDLLAAELKPLGETMDLAKLGFDHAELKRLLSDYSFRASEGFPQQRVGEWKDAHGFYACPPDVRAQIEKRTTLLVQFSGGKDSSGVVLWVARNFKHKRIVLVFVDPGVEFPHMSAHVARVAEHFGVEFAVVKPVDDWWSYWRAKGKMPSLIFRDCAQKFVHAPWAKYVLQHYPADSTALFTGSRAEEAVRGSKKTDRSALPSLGTKGADYFTYHPCFNVKKPVLEEVLQASGIPLWEGYARGFVRTACWCCPGMNGAQALALLENYPGLAEDVRRWERELGPLQPNSRAGSQTFEERLRAGRRQRERVAATAGKPVRARGKVKAKQKGRTKK